MIENPELTVTEVLAHRLVMNEPLDRHENRLFASTLVSQWGVMNGCSLVSVVWERSVGSLMMVSLVRLSLVSIINVRMNPALEPTVLSSMWKVSSRDLVLEERQLSANRRLAALNAPTLTHRWGCHSPAG